MSKHRHCFFKHIISYCSGQALFIHREKVPLLSAVRESRFSKFCRVKVDFLRMFILHRCPKLILCSSINKPNSHDDPRAGQSRRVHVLLPSAAAKRAAIYDERLDFTTRIVAVFTGPYTAPRSRGYMLRFLRSPCTYAGKSRKTAEGTKRPTHIHRLYTSLRPMVSVPANSSWMRRVSYACFEITFSILR